ncbi:MAG: NAD(+) synthase, partial [Candidatus Omnitrophota bacterium]
AMLVKASVSVQKPVLKPRVTASLKPVAEIYGAVVSGTRDYVRKNGFKKVVIGLSGGIESALVAALACDALGCSNVVGISMPTRYNAQETRDDARLLAQNLGIEFHEVPIERIFEAYLEVLKPEFGHLPFDLAEENLQSRIRGNILMAFSNKFGWLVLTTGNKSEMATGYCTLYGDMSGGYAVIKDILKTRVYDLCAFYNQKEGRDIIPLSIFKRPPSAELRFHQTDQDSLPPYALLDQLLGMYVEGHQGFRQMRRVCKDEKIVRKVIELVDKSEYKRRQAPPGVKITQRAFGKDWRLPLTNRYKESV